MMKNTPVVRTRRRLSQLLLWALNDMIKSETAYSGRVACICIGCGKKYPLKLFAVFSATATDS